MLQLYQHISCTAQCSTSLPYSDFRPYIWKYIRSQWQLFWDTQTGNKLHEIHPKIGLWKSSLQLSRKDQVLLTRCRIGHSRLTHSFLLNNEPVPEPVPECVFCACPLTIRHVLLDCADLILLRQQYFNAVSISDLFAVKHCTPSILPLKRYLCSVTREIGKLPFKLASVLPQKARV